MGRNVLSGDEVRFLTNGFQVENGSWKNEIAKRAREDADKRLRSVSETVKDGTDRDLISQDVLREVGSDLHPVEAVDPRQAAADEAEALLAQAREEAESLASNMKEDAKVRAAMMVEKAQTEAKEILRQAKVAAEAEIEVLKKQASEMARIEGLEQGTREGLEKGRQEGKAEYDGVLGEWTGVLQKTIEERNRSLGEMQPLLVELVGEALYGCLKDEGVRNPQMVLRFVEEALSRAHDRVHLTVHLNPENLATVEAKRSELQMSVGSGRIELVPDGRIEKGGCLLETEAGSIDARLSTIVSQVKGALNPGV